MIAPKTTHEKGIVTVRVANASRLVLEVSIRDTNEKITLEGKTYSKYRIVKPEGFEKEEILHRPERGPEALLSLVFTALAESTGKK